MPRNINISICIPTYNKYETIEYTILSVLKQSYQFWELIILDDSNNIFTENVIKKMNLNDSRIKYIKNEERLGMTKNWNECINQSSFEYVYILHHDDMLMPGVLKAYIDFVNLNPECGLIHSNCYYITLPYFDKLTGITQEKSLIEKGDNAIEKILFYNNIASSSVMVKKECYNRLGLFDDKTGISPDWEMWARIGKYYSIGHVDIIGCLYIIDNKNAHLSGEDINDFILQQQYNYKKIISYFSINYINENPDIYLKAEENLEKTILSLSLHYAKQFNFRTSLAYLKKIKFSKVSKFPSVIIKSLIMNIYSTMKNKKTNHKTCFESIYSNYNEN